MEQVPPQYYTLVLTFALPFLLLLIIKLKTSSCTAKASAPLPPGPWTLPIIGTLHHHAGSLPHRAMRDLSQRYGPLMLLKLGEVPTLIVSSPDAAEAVLKAHDLAFASRPFTVMTDLFSYGRKDVAFAPYGDHWRQLRKVYVQELLSPTRVQSFRRMREEEVARLVRSISSASSPPPLVNLSKRFYALTNDIIARAAIGGKCEHQDMYLHEMAGMLKLMGGFNLADLFPSSSLARRFSSATRKAKRCQRRLHCIFESIIEERKHKSAAGIEVHEDNVLDLLLRLQREGGSQLPLTMEIINAVLFDVFAAGSETSGATLEWTMAELVRNPHVMRRAQSEVRRVLHGKTTVTEQDLNEFNYLRLVIKETLRLHPPLPLIPRECLEACQVMGYHVFKGLAVFVNTWAIGRDPRYWVDADQFKPERFEDGTIDYSGSNAQFLPFGTGRRRCPGVAFALPNVELALASLLFHFDWELPSGMAPDELDMAEAFGISAPRRSELLLHAIPRIPSMPMPPKC